MPCLRNWCSEFMRLFAVLAQLPVRKGELCVDRFAKMRRSRETPSKTRLFHESDSFSPVTGHGLAVSAHARGPPRIHSNAAPRHTAGEPAIMARPAYSR